MMRRALLLLTGLLVAGLVWGCSKGGESEDRFQQPTGASEPEKRAAEDFAPQTKATEALRLKAAHARADAAKTPSQKNEAARDLMALFEQLESPSSPHLVAVRQDLTARASGLLLKSSPEEAKRLAELGLSLSDAPSVLRANLYIALADAEKALGNSAGAKSALLNALTINESLFETELQDP